MHCLQTSPNLVRTTLHARKEEYCVYENNKLHPYGRKQTKRRQSSSREATKRCNNINHFSLVAGLLCLAAFHLQPCRCSSGNSADHQCTSRGQRLLEEVAGRCLIPGENWGNLSRQKQHTKLFTWHGLCLPLKLIGSTGRRFYLLSPSLWTSPP